MTLILRKEHDPILTQECKNVPEILYGEREFVTFITTMHKFMANSGGIGLAAPQIGEDTRFFVMGKGKETRFCINPEILEVSEEMEPFREGCLSFPGLRLTIRRPKAVLVRYADPDGVVVEESMDGIMARVFQHEFDHINGTVFTEHVAKLRLKKEKEKARKLLKKTKGRARV